MGYNFSMTDEEQEQAQQLAARMLKQIGWEPSQLQQIRIYARMAPAAKVTQMLNLRHSQIKVLLNQLRREQPNATEAELRQALQRRLALIREAEPPIER